LTEITRIQIQLLPVRVLETFGSSLISTGRGFYAFGKYFLETVRWCFKPPYRWSLVFAQMEFIGNQSLVVLIGGAFAIGAVFGLQIGSVFRVFQAESMLGAITTKALCEEMAPFVTTVLITGRAGAAMTAEIATMRVNEQIDAMEAMAVDPISYLVMPRFIAGMFVMPLLCAVCIFVGVIGSYSVGNLLFDIDEGTFVAKIAQLVEPKDLWRGISKAFAFSTLVTTVCCHFGLTASGGARGVGEATTKAVVSSLLATLFVDVIMTYFQVMW